MKHPVIFDVPPTSGAYLSLLYGARKADILAVCTSGYERPEAVCGMVSSVGLDVPVYRGAEKPVIREVKPSNGALCDWPAPAGERIPADGYAWDAIYSLAKVSTLPVEVIALGNLTNLAIAVLKYPDLGRYLSRIVFYGGALAGGNCSPAPQSGRNLYADPEAAHIVLHSGIPLLAVDIDSAGRLQFSQEELEMMSGYRGLLREHDPGQLYPVGELAAVALADAQEEVETTKLFVTVETDAELARGKLVIQYDTALTGDVPNCRIITGYDVDSLKGRILSAIS